MPQAIQKGGMGIRSLMDVCEAFSLKLWLRFRENQSLWANCLWKKYCKRENPGTIVVKNTDSLVWKRMVKIAASAQDHVSGKLVKVSASSKRMNGQIKGS